MSQPTSPQCFVCDRDQQATPLITLSYRGATTHICPQHLPMLIHDPHSLVGKLPGAENLQPSDHHD